MLKMNWFSKVKLKLTIFENRNLVASSSFWKSLRYCGIFNIGQHCAKMIFPIVRTFSTLQEAELLRKLRQIKPAAEQYVLGMTSGMWRGTSWMDESNPIPPRYGILTSNSSESVKSMLAEVREVG